MRAKTTTKEGTVLECDGDEIRFRIDNGDWLWYEVGYGHGKDYIVGSVHQFKTIPCRRCQQPMSVPPTFDDRNPHIFVLPCTDCLDASDALTEMELAAVIEKYNPADGDELLRLIFQNKEKGLIPVN